MIEINIFDKVEFAKELKNQIKNKYNNDDNNSTILFKLTNSLAQNIEIVYYYLIKLKIKKVILKKENNLDILINHKFKSYIKSNFLINSFLIKTKFDNFSNQELLDILNITNYLDYCRQEDIKAIWDKKLLKKELNRIEKYPELKKYEKYNYLASILTEIPFSKFNIPTQKNQDRFVFYFMVYSKYSQDQIIKHLKELNITEQVINIIYDNNIGTEIIQYAIGFSYENNQEIRITLYCQFREIMMSNINSIKKYLIGKHNLDVKDEYNNISYYAIDFYKNKKEIKIYDQNHIFKVELKDIEINNILKNKECTKVNKYLNNKITDTKYEFSIDDIFNSKEQRILEDKNLLTQNSKILALYIKDRRITKHTNYDL